MLNFTEPSANPWQSSFLVRLDKINTAILLSSGVITFPPAIFAYIRILTIPDFKKEYLLKLFVLNGFSNFLIYMVVIVQTQFTNWPFTYYIYKWLRETPIPLFFRFTQDFAYSFMWQSMFYISLNRYLTIRFDGMTKRIQIKEGICAHYAIYKEGKEYFGIPGTYHQNFMSFITLLVNLMFVRRLKALKQDIGETSRIKGKPEHGLLISSILMFLVHAVQTYIQVHDGYYRFSIAWQFLIVSQYVSNPFIVVCIPLFIAAATTSPFWTLIGFAHSLRRTILNGTPLQTRRDMTVTTANVNTI